jgi:hypothetical protein
VRDIRSFDPVVLCSGLQRLAALYTNASRRALRAVMWMPAGVSVGRASLVAYLNQDAGISVAEASAEM